MRGCKLGYVFLDKVNLFNLCSTQEHLQFSHTLPPSTPGSSRSDMAFDYRTDWGQRFEKLAQIYRAESDAEEDSEYEFPDIPNKPSCNLFLPDKSASRGNRIEAQRPVSSSSDPTPRSPIAITQEGKASPDPSPTPVPAKKGSLREPQASSLQSQSDPQESVCPIKNKGDAPSSPSPRKKDIPTPQQPNYRTLGSSKPQTPPPPSPLPAKRQLSTRPPTPNRYTSDSVVTTISNLYTNPAQRSATLGRKKPLSSSSSEVTKEDETNHRLASDLSKNTEKTSSQESSAEKKSEHRDSVTPIATVKSMKGIETWC